MRTLTSCCALLLGLLLLQPAAAGTGKVNVTSDQDFLVQSVSHNVAMVKLSEMAEREAGGEEVKAFARTIVKEHGRVNERLLEAARDIKVGILTGLEKDRRAIQDRLAGMKGAAFDREFLKQVVADHQRAVGLFEWEAKNGTNVELRKFAVSTLPALREHLKMAQSLSEKNR
jgi:putative membrane protein